MTKPRINFLSDALNHWSVHNRGKALAKFLPEFDVQVRCGLKNPAAYADVNEFDVLHFNFNCHLTEFSKFIRAHRQKVLVTLVNERSYYEGFGVDKAEYHKLLAEIPWITSLSRKLADELNARREGIAKVVYIGNGLDPAIFSQPKDVVVGYAGTWKANKNVKLIEQACQKLGLKLVAAKYKDGSTGEIPFEKMQDFYKQCDVYVHASATEGFNNTILEVLSLNIPVLMTKQGAWKEFEGWVTYIEPSVDDIVSKLQHWAGRKLVLEKFLWEKHIAPQYGNVYRQIIADNTGQTAVVVAVETPVELAEQPDNRIIEPDEKPIHPGLDADLVNKISDPERRLGEACEFFGWPMTLVQEMWASGLVYFEGPWQRYYPQHVGHYYAAAYYAVRQLSYSRGDIFTDQISEWLASIPPGSKVLDVGCGVGDYLLYLGLKGCRVSAVEHEGLPVEFLKWRFARANVPLTVTTQPDWKAGPWDYALLISSLDHIEYPAMLATQLAERVKKQIFATPCKDETYDRPTHIKTILKDVPSAFAIIREHNEKVK